MPKSVRLALYLATRSRGDLRADAVASDDGQDRARQGRPTARAFAGPCVWFHVGADTAAVAQRELARRMVQERDDLGILITSTAEPAVAPEGLEPYITWQPVPYETLPAVRRFLDHWGPDMALWSETDLRPALISEASAREIPMVMVDIGRSRAQTLGSWVRALAPELLGQFEQILVGDEPAKSRLVLLGADPKRIEVSGFLQEGSSALPCNSQERDDLAECIGARPSWAAIQVAPDELEIVLEAHRRAQRRAHRLLLILVPRDPDSGPAWAERLSAAGHTVALRSAEQDPDGDVQIYVADVPGELGLWYRLAPISFLGQSFTAGAVPNPFDAAALGSAIVHGPEMQAHMGAFQRLAQARATRLAQDAKELGAAIDALLSPAVVAEMARRAWEVSSDGAETTDRLIDLILTRLEDA